MIDFSFVVKVISCTRRIFQLCSDYPSKGILLGRCASNTSDLGCVEGKVTRFTEQSPQCDLSCGTSSLHTEILLNP